MTDPERCGKCRRDVTDTAHYSAPKGRRRIRCVDCCEICKGRDLEHIEGLFVGQLDEAEMKMFEQAVSEHRAYRSYEDLAGFLGLAKVRLVSVVVS